MFSGEDARGVVRNRNHLFEIEQLRDPLSEGTQRAIRLVMRERYPRLTGSLCPSDMVTKHSPSFPSVRNSLTCCRFTIAERWIRRKTSGSSFVSKLAMVLRSMWLSLPAQILT